VLLWSDHRPLAWQDKYASAIEWVSRHHGMECEFDEEAEQKEAVELHTSCLLNAAQCALCWLRCTCAHLRRGACAHRHTSSHVRGVMLRGVGVWRVRTGSLKLSDWPEVVKSCTSVLAMRGLPTASKVNALRRGHTLVHTSSFFLLSQTSLFTLVHTRRSHSSFTPHRAHLPAACSASQVKALFRRGTAQIKSSNFAEARTDLKEACTLDPKSKEIREMYGSVKEAEGDLT
jgi:hypothetical protein